ncbi:MAG: hypothetical protein QNJ92_01040 [Alphaproteobacteria bacterium]|nr:hypothetical protein [Alphaproteobacteria bacterium]
MKPIITGLLVIGLLAPAMVLADDWKQLKEGDLKGLFPGATISGRTDKGAPFEAEYKTDGSLVGLSQGYADEGKWWVNGDTICRKWGKWDQGRERCSRIEVNGADYRYQRVDGSGSGTYTLKK